ncbi:MAG TPA: hypothetical protein VFE10_05350 [Phenylobacterium sp.]|nr:hypothetical protein [Phenylobacterium sp.]
MGAAIHTGGGEKADKAFRIAMFAGLLLTVDARWLLRPVGGHRDQQINRLIGPARLQRRIRRGQSLIHASTR